MHENMRLAYVCVSFACSLVFSCLIFPIFVCLYFYYNYYLDVYLYSNEREKQRVCAWMDWEGVSGRSLGEEKL